MKIKITYQVNMDDETIDVLFVVKYNITNTGIGDYEYMGSREYDKGEDVLRIEDTAWNERLYTLKENDFISKAVKTDSFYDAVVSEHNTEAAESEFYNKQ